MICVCLPCISQQGPCVSAAVLNPPLEMGTWLPFGFPHRLGAALPDSQTLGDSDSSGTHLEAIWGSNPLLLPLFFFLPSSLALHPPPHHHPNASSRPRLKEALRA